MKKLIVFDMDGTLYMTETSFLPAVEEFFARYNKPLPTLERLYSFIGEPAYVFKAWIESLKIEKDLKSLLHEFNELERQAVIDHGQLYPNALETLQWLNSEGYTVALCSNGQSWFIDAILDKFGLRSLFQSVKVPLTKEHTKTIMLKELLDEFNPDESFMVGDRHHDMEGAHNNQMRFIGALYGFGSHEVGVAPRVALNLNEIKTILTSV